MPSSSSHSALPLLASLLYLSSLWAPSFALPTNFTVDDSGATTDGLQIVYEPGGAWSSGQDDRGLDIRRVYNGTLHTAGRTGSPSTASLTFEGERIYVYCVIANASTDPIASTGLSFAIDGQQMGTFQLPLDTNATYLYNVPVYVNETMPAGQHTFMLTDDGAGEHTALALLDYIVISRDVSSNDDPSHGSHPVSTAATPLITAGTHVLSAAATSSPPSHRIKNTTIVALSAVLGTLFIVLLAFAVFYYARRRSKALRRAAQSLTAHSEKGEKEAHKLGTASTTTLPQGKDSEPTARSQPPPGFNLLARSLPVPEPVVLPPFSPSPSTPSSATLSVPAASSPPPTPPKKAKHVPPALPLDRSPTPSSTSSTRPLPRPPSTPSSSMLALAPTPATHSSPMSTFTLAPHSPISPFVVPGVSARRVTASSMASVPGLSPATEEADATGRWRALGMGNGAGARTRVWEESAASPRSPASSESAYTAADVGSAEGPAAPPPVAEAQPGMRPGPQPLQIDIPRVQVEGGDADARTPPQLSASTSAPASGLMPIATPVVVSAEPVPKGGPWTTASTILERRALESRPLWSPSLFGGRDVGSPNVRSAWSPESETGARSGAGSDARV